MNTIPNSTRSLQRTALVACKASPQPSSSQISKCRPSPFVNAKSILLPAAVCLLLLSTGTRAADITWTNPASGNWSTAANWSPNQVPGSADTAWITNNGTYAVTLDVDATVAHLQLGGTSGTQTFNHSSRTLALNGSSAGTARAVYALSGGGSLAGSGLLALAGPLNWTGGSISGWLQCNGGTISSGASKALNGARLVNTGVLNVSDGWSSWTSPSVTNAAGATLDFINDASDSAGNTGGPGTIWNSGLLRKSGGTGTSTINPAFNNLAGGRLEVNSGTLNLTGGGNNSGTNLVAGGTVLNFSGGIQTLDASSWLGGDGTVLCNGSTTLNFTGTFALTSLLQLTEGAYFYVNAGVQGAVAQLQLSATSGMLGGNGLLVVTGPLTWTGGSISGWVQCYGGTISPGSIKYLGGGRLVNTGVLSVSALDWNCSGNGAITNAAGAIFDFVNDSGAIAACCGGPGTIYNYGLLRKSGGTGTSTISPAFNNLPGGALQVNSGTVNLGGGGNNSGTNLVAAGTVLNFSAGTQTLDASSWLGGDGTVLCNGSTTLNFTGTFALTSLLQLTEGAHFYVNAGVQGTVAQLQLSATSGMLGGNGLLVVTGPLTWTGGSISGWVQCYGGTISPGSIKYLGGGRLVNTGVLSVSALDWNCSGNGAITNAAGAIFDFVNDSGAIAACCGGPGTIYNYGLLRKSGGTGTSTISPAFNNLPGGALQVNSGTVNLGGGGNNSGTNLVAAGTVLNFSAGTQTLDASSWLGGDGTVLCSGSTTLNFTGTFALTSLLQLTEGAHFYVNAGVRGTVAQLQLSATSGMLGGNGLLVVTGPLTWTGGSISGWVQCNGGTIGTGTIKYLSGSRLVNTGILTVRDSFNVNSGQVITNQANGTIDLANDSSLNAECCGGPGTVYNYGLLSKSGGAGTSVMGFYFVNNGTLRVQSGTMQFLYDYGQTAGLTLLSGGRLQVDQPLALSGGTLAGTNTLTGSVNNNGGTLSPGASPGKLTITGNYVQGSGGAMTVGLGGTAPGTGFDQLAVGGSATLAGTLNASLYGTFYPAPAATFTFLTAGSRSGTFSSFNYPSNLVGLTVDYAATTATIRVINTLPVITPVGDRTNDEMVAFNVTAIANDYDTPAQTLTWFLAAGPAGLSISSGGAISWTPAEDQGPSTNTVKICAKDNGTPNLTATNTFQLVINEINRAPSLFLPPDTTINELTSLSVSASATDPDIPSNALSFGLVSPPPGMTIDPASGAIAWAPTEALGPSTYTITVSVTDTNPWAVNEQSLTTIGTFKVTVREVNTAPVLTVPGTQTINELTLLTVTNTAADVDIPINPLTFAIVSGPTGAVINVTSGVLTWTPSEEQGPSTNVFVIAVTDSSPDAVNEQHLSDTNRFTVVVNEVNSPPSLAPLADRIVNPGETISVLATATDPDIPTNTVTFSLQGPPAGAHIDPTNGLFEWRPAMTQANSTNLIQVEVTDSNPWALDEQHLSDTNSFTVIVNPLQPCVLAPASLDASGLRLLVTGCVGPDYSIQTSSNLLDWSELVWTNPVTMPITVVDTNAASFSSRFYRALLSP